MGKTYYKLQITLVSYDTNSYQKYLNIFDNLKNDYKVNTILTHNNQTRTRKKTKDFTLLKSPHVNKKSQEKFRYKTYNMGFHIISSELEALYEISNLTFLGGDLQVKVIITQEIL